MGISLSSVYKEHEADGGSYDYEPPVRERVSQFPTNDSVDVSIHPLTPVRTVLVYYQEQGDLCARPETHSELLEPHDGRGEGLRLFCGILVHSLH